MISFKCQPWIGLLTVLLNDLGLWILLFASVINITNSNFDVLSSLFLILVSLLLLLIINLNETSTITSCFCGLLQGLDFPASDFRFGVTVSNGHLANNFTLYSNLLM